MRLQQFLLGLLLSSMMCLLSGCALFGVPENAGPPPGTPGPTPTPTPAPPPPGQGTPPTLGNITKINHIIFMAQENRSFDHYFGHLNDFRVSQGLGADVDGTPAAV